MAETATAVGGVDDQPTFLPNSSQSEPLPPRPFSSGAPLRRSLKVSDLSVGNINTINDDNKNSFVQVEDKKEVNKQINQDEEFTEIPLTHMENRHTDVQVLNSLKVPSSHGTPIKTFADVPELTITSLGGSYNEIKKIAIESAIDSNVTKPAVSKISSLQSSINKFPAYNPSVVKISEFNSNKDNPIKVKPNIEPTTVTTDFKVDEIDIITDKPSMPETFPIEVVEIAASASPLTSSGGRTRSTRHSKGENGDAGGDKQKNSSTGSSSTGYTGSTEYYQAEVMKSKKNKDLYTQITQGQHQYDEQHENDYQQYKNEQQKPSVTTTGVGAISFKVPGRITHKTTIKIAHYPQAGNEIISVEQPMQGEAGAMNCYDPNPMFENEYGQYPNGNYSNNCNFCTYNINDPYADPNAMVQMQQQNPYWNQYGYNYNPYGYGPYGPC